MLFSEGQDPLDQGANVGRMPTGAPEPPPFSGPSSGAIVGAAFRQNNPVVSVLDALSRSRPDMTPVPGYDPVQRLSGTKDDDLIDQSLADVNPAQTDARIAKKQAEQKDQETLAAAGWAGTAASVAAGALDPSWFIPIAGELRAGLGAGFAVRAVRGGIEGAVKSAVSETALQGSQVTRTPGESVSAIATNTLLMGLIGGGMGMLERGEHATAAAGLNEVRADFSPPVTIKAAAVKYGDKVYTGGIHPDAVVKLAEDLGADVSTDEKFSDFYTDKYDDMQEGFLTSEGEFVGRKKAAQIAEEAGQYKEARRGQSSLDALEITIPGRDEISDRFKKLDDARNDNYGLIMTIPDRRPAPDAEVSAPTLTRSLSAAEADQRTMKLARIMLPETFSAAIGETPVIGPIYNWTAATMMRFSPTLRIFSSDSLSAKRAMGDLAETSLRFTQSEQGITTAQGGIPIDRIVKMQVNKGRMDAAHILRDAFVEYRGLEEKSAPIIRSAVQDFRGQAAGKMSYDDFKTEVTLAASNGDAHQVPQVAAAAQKLRAQVLEPIKRMAQQVMGPDGKPMLAEELAAPKGDKSFFPRSWNKQALAARHNDAKKVFADWLENDQATKAAAKERLTALNDKLEAAGKRLERAKSDEDMIAAKAEHDAIRAKIEKEIAGWEGRTTTEAKAALKARAEAEKARAEKIAEGTYQGKGERLTGADGAVDRAVKSILNSDRALSREELENRAAEIIHRINVAPDGRLAYEAGGGGEPVPTGAQQVRGSLNARDFAIPTHLVKDFIHTDTEHIIAGHLRATVPDIHLTDRFGDIAMTDVFRRVNEEYDAKIAGKGERESTRLDNERKAMVRDLAATRDRIRGIYGFNLAASQPNAARIANAARNWNLIADLGTSVFNRLTDSTNAVWRHGLINVFGDAYLPFIKSMLAIDASGTAQRQAMKDMGVGIDSHLGHLSHQWGDVIDNYLPGSKFERALAWAADKSMIVNLHGPWTDSMKVFAGSAASPDFLRMAERVAAGEAKPEDIQRLAQAGIAPHMAERIWKAYKDGGGEEFGKGTHVPNTADWTDRQARDVFTAAIQRSADLAVLTPGLEKPLTMSAPVLSLLGQYKSFVAAAHEKILISNLQQMDGRTLQGLIAAIGMGMLSYRAYTLWSGAPTSDRPQDWIKEGISRSAIGGWYTDLNQIQAKFTGGNTDAFRLIGADHPLSRRQSNSALSEMLGPTYSRLEGIAGGLNDASHGTWSATDTHKLRQAMWLQNLFVTRRLLDSVEDGFNESIGVKPSP